MAKRLKEKMNTLLQARKENKNKGFTLVELIVVIVILAILVGVTIGGIYGYVNKSRINTDINNASTLSSTLNAIVVNKDIANASVSAVTNKIIATPTAESSANDIATAILGASATDKQKAVINNLIPDGTGKTKVGILVLSTTIDKKKDTDTTGSISSIKVSAYENYEGAAKDGTLASGKNPLEGQE